LCYKKIFLAASPDWMILVICSLDHDRGYHMIPLDGGLKKMKQMKDTTKRGELIKLAMECMGVAVTIIDTQGTLLCYNKEAARILHHKPEYMGKDIHSHQPSLIFDSTECRIRSPGRVDVCLPCRVSVNMNRH
jgi:transcriptional regulator with PAS, ATPase and Fis domain